MTVAVRYSSSSSSSSSSSFVPNSYKYDVFISFRGEDTRNNFTSHLYAALRRSSIETYIDERSLERGEEISPALLTAIEESQLSLVVFSQNYASSTWCLDELVHILKCKKENGQIVIPLFYHVDPSDVRNQRGGYGAAFVAHQKRSKLDRNKVEVWRNTLKEAAGLSGFDLKDESEAEFIENIVKDVWEKLKIISSPDDFEGLVGMNKHFHELELLLSVGSPDVRILGIWGMGGIGKTTLAKALCTQFSPIFDSCFFMDAKENLFYELLRDGILRRRKALVVLDNVDELQQLEYLLRVHDVPADFYRWFSVGCRIITTSRDKKLLNDIADEIYEVKALDYNEARKLLYMKAFKRDSDISGYEMLVDRVLWYAEGNPLALEVLGSYLRGRSKEEWESTLGKLERCPNKRIQNVLKLSFDALDRIEKSIFLDFACFFNGKDRDFLETIHGDEAHIGISVLIERSLITVTERSKIIRMHGLIKDMGREIASKEGTRFWITKDVLKVLENNKGNDKIEGISLNMSEVDENLCLEPTVFQEMYNLRVLMIYDPYQYLHEALDLPSLGKKSTKLSLDKGLSYLPNSLRYLQWYHYPLKTFPPKFRPACLVHLEMPHSQLTHLWHAVQPLGNLKDIDLRYSFQLVKIPDLSRATRLEYINLQSCRSLVELPPIKLYNFDNGVQPLGNLSHVSRPKSTDCQDSKSSVEVSSLSFPFFRNKRLGNLKFSKCTRLKFLSELSGSIRFLNLSKTRIKELPSSIRSCESLLKLNLSGCEDLEMFPELPRNIEHLDLSFTSIREMPATSIECLHRVRKIGMQNCERLESLPSNFCKLKALKMLDLSGCSNLKSFPEISEPMENLSHVDLSSTGIHELHTSSENLTGLERLEMEDCINLKTIPEGLGKLSCLSSLSFSGCSKIESFPNMLLGLCSLKELNLNLCNIFEIPSSIRYLTSLTKLNLGGNMFASIPPGIKQLHKLVELDIRDCMNLRSLPELPLSVETIIADGCMSLGTVLETSRSTLSQVCLNNFSGYLKFMFRGCLKLNESACENIAMDILLKIAPIYWRKKGLMASRIELCYSGNRIPECIRHQSEGFSKLTIKLPPNWHSSNFLGFVACVVLSFEELCRYVEDNLSICCTIHLKTTNGQSHCEGTFAWPCNKSCLNHEGDIEIFRGSGHVFMWYMEFYGNYSDAVEMLVDFFCGHSSEENIGEYSSKYEVKRCGVHMLYYIEEGVIKKYNMDIKKYMDDTEQLGITMRQDILFLQDASHSIIEETPSNNDDRHTAGHSRDSTANHEEMVNLILSPSSVDSADDQTNNIVEGNSDAIENMPEPSATPVINFDVEESCSGTIKCFDFCSCSRLILDWIQGSRGN